MEPNQRQGPGAARVQGVTLAGAAAAVVTVQARFEPAGDDAKGRREVAITGLPDAVIRESRGRLLAALAARGVVLPAGRLLLHLAPAALRKEGELLDLPLVLGAAAAAGALPPAALDGALFLGEVALDGGLRAVPGGLAAADAAVRAGLRDLVAPPATAREAAALPGVRAFACEDLTEVLALLSGTPAAPVRPARDEDPDDPLAHDRPLLVDEVRGQALGKRALEVAAAGGHGLLFTGPPGAGKSLLARALVDLLPPLSDDERVEVTRVLSAAGRWPGGLATRRSFRAPHHTTSHAGLVGGGNPPVPGEITLAHRGVLFLDELPEFRRETLEGLRQPLEEGHILVARAGRRARLPAAFQLVCARNPCPCGYRGHPKIPCRCAPTAVARYAQRISGPLLDRIDLHLELTPPPLDALLAPAAALARPSPADPDRLDAHEAPDARQASGESAAPGASDPTDADGPGATAPGTKAHGTATAAQPPPGGDGRARIARVRAARAAADARQDGPNARLAPSDLDRHAPLDGPMRDLLTRAAERLALSARAVQALRRVARTLADLDGAELPDRDHLAEALALRRGP